MCRNIKPLFNYQPIATEDEIQAAALQYVRKVSGFQKPSQANEAVFSKAIDEITHATKHLLHDLTTTSAPKNRELEAQKARERNKQRFGN